LFPREFNFAEIFQKEPGFIEELFLQPERFQHCAAIYNAGRGPKVVGPANFPPQEVGGFFSKKKRGGGAEEI